MVEIHPHLAASVLALQSTEESLVGGRPTEATRAQFKTIAPIIKPLLDVRFKSLPAVIEIQKRYAALRAAVNPEPLRSPDARGTHNAERLETLGPDFDVFMSATKAGVVRVEALVKQGKKDEAREFWQTNVERFRRFLVDPEYAEIPPIVELRAKFEAVHRAAFFVPRAKPEATGRVLEPRVSVLEDARAVGRANALEKSLSKPVGLPVSKDNRAAAARSPSPTRKSQPPEQGRGGGARSPSPSPARKEEKGKGKAVVPEGKGKGKGKGKGDEQQQQRQQQQQSSKIPVQAPNAGKPKAPARASPSPSPSSPVPPAPGKGKGKGKENPPKDTRVSVLEDARAVAKANAADKAAEKKKK